MGESQWKPHRRRTGLRPWVVINETRGGRLYHCGGGTSRLSTYKTQEAAQAAADKRNAQDMPMVTT